jgi:hypothetical protein
VAVDWTEDLIATLRRLVTEEGCSLGEAGRRMRITKNAAIGKAQRLGITSRFKPSGTVKVRWDPKGEAPLVMEQESKPSKETRVIPRPPVPPKSAPPHVGASPTCCWPLWGHKERPREYRFCGAPSKQGQSWCPEHYGAVFSPSPRREGAAAEFRLRQIA